MRGRDWVLVRSGPNDFVNMCLSSCPIVTITDRPTPLPSAAVFRRHAVVEVSRLKLGERGEVAIRFRPHLVRLNAELESLERL